MAVFIGKFLSESDFEAILTTCCCYDYGVNTTEAVKKITADQKDYQKCLLCVIVSCIPKNIINKVKKVWLLRHHLRRR